MRGYSKSLKRLLTFLSAPGRLASDPAGRPVRSLVSPLVKEDGLALVMTLLIIVILTALILEFDFSARTDLRAAVNYRDGTKAHYLAQSGVAAAKAVLRDDIRHSGQYDAFNELWAAPFPAYPVGDGTVTVSIQDEGGKLNPNDLVNMHDQPVPKKVGQMKRLFELLELEPGLVDGMIDWVDKNNDPTSGYGAEDDFYRRLDPPYRAKNAKLTTLSELHQIRGITDEIYRRIAPYLTVYSDPSTAQSEGPMNINTADALVLQTLPTLEVNKEEFPITEDLAAKIMESRPFKDCKDLDKVAGISSDLRLKVERYCTVRSSYFTVVSSGNVQGLIKTVRAVVRRQGNSLETLFWKLE